MRDLTYPPIIIAALGLFRGLDLRFDTSGTEHVPREGGVLLAFNHISYMDFILGGFAAHPSRRRVRFMAKREIFDHRVAGPIMRSMHHISVDRGEGAGSLAEALEYLKSGEAVGIFPEATVSRSFEVKELKSGSVRIAAEAGVPLVPVALWGTQRILTKDHRRDFSRGKTIGIRVGEPMYPTAVDPLAETLELHHRLSTLVDEAIDAYPPEEQPPGSWWLPASRGGTAPTPEVALRMEAEEKARRAAKKAAREAKRRQNDESTSP